MLSREEQTKRWLIVHIYIYIVQKNAFDCSWLCVLWQSLWCCYHISHGCKVWVYQIHGKEKLNKTVFFSGLDLLLLEGFLRTLPSITLHILRKITAKWKSLMQEMLMVIHSTSWLPWIKHICTPRNCGIRQVESLVLGEIIPCHGACSELPGM